MAQNTAAISTLRGFSLSSYMCLTMRGAEGAINSQLIQNGPPRTPSAKLRITYFRNIVKLSPQSSFTQAAIPSLLRGAFDQRLTDVGRGAGSGGRLGALEMRRQ